MALLTIGLFMFLSVHSLRLCAADWRAAMIGRIGPKPWRGVISLLSLAGLALIVIGFGQARAEPVVLYQAPLWLSHVTILLMAISFILLAAAFVPGNGIKARIGHPMLAAVKLWALAHLLVNGRAHDVLLFGALLIWSVADFAVSRRRDRRLGLQYPAGTARGTILTAVIGLAAWALFGLVLHGLLFGVEPFGRL